MDKKNDYSTISQHHIRYIISLVAIQKKEKKRRKKERSRDDYAIYPFIYNIINILYKMQVVLGAGVYLEKR